jgi:hypothetical protein
VSDSERLSNVSAMLSLPFSLEIGICIRQAGASKTNVWNRSMLSIEPSTCCRQPAGSRTNAGPPTPLFPDAVGLVECFVAPHEASRRHVALLYELKLTPKLASRNIVCVTSTAAP